MRKSFKVATVFTGTAAAAAVFAPAAGAVTVKPDAVHYNCSANTLTDATVLYWPAAAHHGPTCVSGGGYTNLGNTSFQYFCAGQYYGDILYTNGGHRYYAPGNGKGTIDTKVKSVYISAASISYLCSA